MKNKNIERSLVISLITIIIFSAISPFTAYENVNQKTIKEMKQNINFVEKSAGLEIPEKEGGNTELKLADINNDGNLDIICVGDHGSPYVNTDQHGIMVWLGDGEGNWSVNQVGDFGYGGIEAGDLNLDGYLDVVWGVHHNYGTPGFGDTLIGAALGDGTGTNWIPWATGLGTNGEDWGMFETDLADFDCNGLLDIISQSFGCCNAYHLYKNNGDGTWTHMWSNTGGNTNNNLETADFNADGYPDFAGNRDGFFVYLGDGTFDFTLAQDGLPTTNWNGLDCGDMNNDGCDDLVIGYSSSGVHCYTFNKQNNEWDETSEGLPNSGAYYPQFGDIDGDGYLDIVAYIGPTGYVFLGDGDGNWISDVTFTMPSSGGYSAFAVDGDFDHDGREDVVIQAEEGDWISYQNKLKAFSPWLEPTELTALIQIPHGGETYRSGSIRDIRWLSAVPLSEGDSNVEIQVSTDDESGPWRSIANNLPNNGCYQWLVDAGGSNLCRIKIIVKSISSTTSAISESDFKIIGYNVNAHGPYTGGVNEPIQFTGTAENGESPYEFYWEFGDGKTSQEQNPTHNYNVKGNYSVTLTVTDSNDITIRDITNALIKGENNPPNKPIIDGPKTGKPDIEYQYTFVSTDEDNDKLSYLIDWGDGTQNQTEEFSSGIIAYINHSWSVKGINTIKAKAIDGYGMESEWGQFTVTIPRNNLRFSSFLIRYFEMINEIEKFFN